MNGDHRGDSPDGTRAPRAVVNVASLAGIIGVKASLPTPHPSSVWSDSRESIQLEFADKGDQNSPA